MAGFAMPSPRAIFLALFALCIATAAILGAGCDSTGTVIATDAGAGDATGPDVVVNFDGPTLFDVAAPVDSGAGEADAAPSSDAAAFAFIEFSEVPVGGGTFTAAFFAAPRQPPPGCAGQVPDGGFGDAGIQVGADNLGSYHYNTTGPMFAPGDMLGVSGAGGTVPAFPMQTLAAPAAITVTSPEPGDGGTLVIPTSKSLAVTWTGGVPGDHVIFTLNVLFASGASASTACSWDAQAGQGTVPANALGPLVAAHSRARLAADLNAAGVPCGPVNDIRDAFALATELGLGSIVEMAEGVRQVANPISLDGTPVSYRRIPPRLGADDAAVRAWLGAGEGELTG